MPAKYHIETKTVEPRFFPVPKLSAIESDGCLGCVQCVKRDSCVYDVYKKRKFDTSGVIDTADVLCINCLRCVQECKKNILFRIPNPEYERLGDEYWRPDIITSIWEQSKTGKIPVSGAGYRGLFAAAGFDSMWTDMSEIVRPTRDGIHGREYISTVIELGRRPGQLQFNEQGDIITDIPPFTEIPIPVVLDLPDNKFVTDSTKEVIAAAAVSVNTFAVASLRDANGVLEKHRQHLIVRFDPANEDVKSLHGTAIVELAWSKDIQTVIEKINAANPGIIISVRLPLDENSVKRAVALVAQGPGIIHLQATYKGKGFGKRSNEFIIKLVKEVHFALLKENLRDQVTILLSGGMALAEHAAKIIACGADGVALDTALLVALGCRLCPDCSDRKSCPVEINTTPSDWGAQRIINLIGSWHSQLIEVLGAMGLREVRRLRGELGRVMFFEDLENDNLGPFFGKRIRSLEESLKSAANDKHIEPAKEVKIQVDYPADYKKLASPCPSRFRNSLSVYRVVRTAECISCGKCAEVCRYGVHVKAGRKMLAPKSHLCRGPEVCRLADSFCVDSCPVNALRVGPDPMWKAFGDPRWTSDLLVSAWEQAATGLPPERNIEYKRGASGGGFDRIDIVFPDKIPDTSFKPEDVDIGITLNKRQDDRPEVPIGIPFYGGGMSYGSISLATMLSRAKAYKAFNSFTCSGEGGYPEELKEYDDNVITQVATGLFGVREETIQRVRIVEFKYAQGAKPGLGGHLLGDKVTPAVAQMRESVVGSALFSPFPFHSVYSVEDHKKHVDWIKEINPRALIAVKVSTPTDVDMVAVGSYYAGAHIIHLDGSYGGTGAAPDIAKKNIAMPIEYAIPKVHRFLLAEGIRDRMTLIASGGLRTAWDIAKAVALGANGAVIGTAELVALECIRCGVCESGRGCPRGIATTDAELSVMFEPEWATQRIINLFHSWSVQLQWILWRLGMRSIVELVGRSDLLRHLDYDNVRDTCSESAEYTEQITK
jgi:glutamate synthase domain-containing protein 2/Na+-translocating ferredoxin:NAD+ oxidoreductase RNF subunit RnfB